MSNPQVPNVVIKNPRARKAARAVLDVVGVGVGLIVVIDGATDAFTLSQWTVPALAGYAFLRAAFGVGVDNPNTPSA